MREEEEEEWCTFSPILRWAGLAVRCNCAAVCGGGAIRCCSLPPVCLLAFPLPPSLSLSHGKMATESEQRPDSGDPPSEEQTPSSCQVKPAAPTSPRDTLLTRVKEKPRLQCVERCVAAHPLDTMYPFPMEVPATSRGLLSDKETLFRSPFKFNVIFLSAFHLLVDSFTLVSYRVSVLMDFVCVG